MTMLISKVSPVDCRKEVENAWNQLPEKIQKTVAEWGDERLNKIKIAATESMNPLVSPSSLGKNARDRLKATIASEAIEDAAAGRELFELVLQSMRDDITQEGHRVTKEQI